ncbi:MAG TPA: histidine kinase, partial [Cyclobacteriaceae bacterium]|nr:histidine kinase [Cyclobacteriaceae bacterium]
MYAVFLMGDMDSNLSFPEYIFKRQRWIMHMVFWIFVLAFYVVFFGRRNSNYVQTFFFVGLLMPVTIATTYFLNYYLLPRYLMRERYWFFILYFIYTLIASIFLEMMIAMLTLIVMAQVRIRDMSPATFDVVFILTSLLMVVFSGVAIKLLLHWRTAEQNHQKLIADKVEAELKFLKVQLNPHFLFNTLNNLYYLTTEKSERAPQAILQLSEMLDYVMHSSKKVFVPLEDELKQVNNYVALEMLRYEERVKVDVKLAGHTAGHFVGPMILITLVENAFKHGVMKSAKASWIRILVECLETGLRVDITNSVSAEPSGNGIGLENLKRQLDYLYTGKYELNV